MRDPEAVDGVFVPSKICRHCHYVAISEQQCWYSLPVLGTALFLILLQTPSTRFLPLSFQSCHHCIYHAPVLPSWQSAPFLKNYRRNLGQDIFRNTQEASRFRAHYISIIVQELCESRGGRPGLSVLTSLLVSVDVKLYWTMLRHWSQLVPNMSTDNWGH